MKIMNYKLIFLIEILAFISMSFMAVAMEGSTGGLFGKNMIYGLSADFWIFSVMVPLFLLIPLIVHGFDDSKLFGTLLIGYLIGIVLEDFCWFIINPNFGILRFNSKYATWINWINLGLFEIPCFYIINPFLAFLAWFIFIKNERKVNLFIKNSKWVHRLKVFE